MMTPAARPSRSLIGFLDGCRIRNLKGQAGVAGRLIVVLLGFVAIEAVAAQAGAEGQIREVVGARVETGQFRNHRRAAARHLAGDRAAQLSIIGLGQVLVAAEADHDDSVDRKAGGGNDRHGGLGFALEFFGRRRLGQKSVGRRAQALCKCRPGFEIFADKNHQIAAIHIFEGAEVDF